LGGIEKKPRAMTNEEWEILDKKDLGAIQLSLAASDSFNISKVKTMKDFMDAFG
jgi:hypothetical protein